MASAQSVDNAGDDRLGWGPTAARVGVVALLTAYVAFAWPGLVHFARDVLGIEESWTVAGFTARRAWLFAAAVDGAIYVAATVLLTHRRLEDGVRRELRAGMWACAALSGLGLVVDEWYRLAGRLGWVQLAVPLVLAPVAIATWWLDMIVRAYAPVYDEAPRAVEAQERPVVVPEKRLPALHLPGDLTDVDDFPELGRGPEPAPAAVTPPVVPSNGQPPWLHGNPKRGGPKMQCPCGEPVSESAWYKPPHRQHVRDARARLLDPTGRRT